MLVAGELCGIFLGELALRRDGFDIFVGPFKSDGHGGPVWPGEASLCLSDRGRTTWHLA